MFWVIGGIRNTPKVIGLGALVASISDARGGCACWFWGPSLRDIPLELTSFSSTNRIYGSEEEGWDSVCFLGTVGVVCGSSTDLWLGTESSVYLEFSFFSSPWPKLLLRCPWYSLYSEVSSTCWVTWGEPPKWDLKVAGRGRQQEEGVRGMELGWELGRI